MAMLFSYFLSIEIMFYNICIFYNRLNRSEWKVVSFFSVFLAT